MVTRSRRPQSYRISNVTYGKQSPRRDRGSGRVETEASQTRRQVLQALALIPLSIHRRAFTSTETAAPSAIEKRRKDAKGRFEGYASRNKKLDSRLVDLVAKVDQTKLAHTLTSASSLGSRWSLSPKIAEARDWIRRSFVEAGYADDAIAFRSFDLDGRELHNVVCSHGRLDTGFLAICCHYDSVSTNPLTSAPGADDNGSGIAAMMEVARILRTVRLKRGVLYIAFCAEEQGLIGSRALARLAKQEAWPLDVLVNLDMIGWVDPNRPKSVTLEFDQGNSSNQNDPSSKAFGFQLGQAVADFTSLSVEYTDIWNSDYMPFEELGYPCIGIYDGGADAAFYHTQADLPQVVSIERLTEVTKALLAFTASTANFA